jgi:hypothetical protein
MVATQKVVLRQEEWRGGGGHVSMVGPEADSASPLVVAKHKGLRRHP